MRPVQRLAVLVFLVAVASILAADDKKKGDGKTAATSEQDYKKLGQAHELMGKLLSVQASDRTLTLEIEYEFLEPKNKNALSKMNAQQQRLYKDQQQLLNDQQKAATSRNPAQAAKHLRKLQEHAARMQKHAMKGNDLFKVSTARKDFDLEAVENVKVRLAKLPIELDEKGKPRKLTDKELKERKGPDPNLPGYSSSFAELRTDQIVQVTLGKAGAAKDSKDKDGGDEQPKITMIVVIEDVDPAAAPSKRTKKKK